MPVIRPESRVDRPESSTNTVRPTGSNASNIRGQLWTLVITSLGSSLRIAHGSAPVKPFLQNAYQVRSFRSASIIAWKAERIASPKFGHATDTIIRLVRVDTCVTG